MRTHPTPVVRLVALSFVVLAACFPDLTGAPCRSDENCPSTQRCGPALTCVNGARDAGAGGEGGGTAGVGGAAGTGGGTAGTGGGAAGTGGGTGDSTRPVVQSTTPSDMTGNVAISTTVQVVFSEAMNPSTVSLTTLPLLTMKDAVWSAGNTTATFEPTSSFAHAQRYQINVNGSDVAGNAIAPAHGFSFTTEAVPDLVPPTVTNTLPSNMGTDVATTASITITFSEPMRPMSAMLTSMPSLTFGTPTWADNNTSATFTVSNGMMASTTYSLNIVARDASGNIMAQPYAFAFVTTTPPDTMAPRLMSSVPVDLATNVATSTRLSLTFSEGMNRGSLVVGLSPKFELGPVSWNNPGRVATFSTPMEDWAPGTVYTLTVAATDLAGNPLPATGLSFTTATPPDTTPPTVASTAPPPSSTGVPAVTDIEINFSEPMQQALTEAALSITPAVSCTKLWNTARTVMVCNPTSDLAASTVYTVRVGTGAVDDAGNALASPYMMTFTTAAAPDITRPTVVSTDPAQGAVGVPRFSGRAGPIIIKNQPYGITVTFSEPMRQLPTQAAFSITSPAGYGGGTFEWDSRGRAMHYVPPSAFPNGTSVTFQVGTGAEDLAGNDLSAVYNGAFRVKRQATSSFYASGILNSGTTSELDGYIIANASCTVGSVGTGSALTYAGDRSVSAIPPGQLYRGYLTFSLAPLALLTDVVIESASLNVYQATCTGNPFAAAFGGSINAYHVYYGDSLDLGDCATPLLTMDSFELSTSTAAGLRSVSVLSKVRDDFMNRGARQSRSQFLLRTATVVSNGDTTYDYCSYSTYNYMGSSSDPYLNITYEYD